MQEYIEKMIIERVEQITTGNFHHMASFYNKGGQYEKVS